MKVECDLKDVFEVTYSKLWKEGLLLASVGRDGGYNAMTIGWGLVGRMWSEPVFVVAVRPSMWTHRLIDETKEFTVNVPGDGMEEAVSFCGTVSGRDHDKFEETGLTAERGRSVKSPIIPECVVHYECEVIGRSTLVPEDLSCEVRRRSYASGNYHILYFGKILSILRDE